MESSVLSPERWEEGGGAHTIKSWMTQLRSGKEGGVDVTHRLFAESLGTNHDLQRCNIFTVITEEPVALKG